MQLGGAERKGCRMKQPARNRQRGGYGPAPAVKGSAGKIAGRGSAFSGGTAYSPQPSKHAKTGMSASGYGPKSGGGKMGKKSGSSHGGGY